MYKLIIIAALCSAANAGAIHAPVVPAVGATLVGSVSYNAPEVTVVKQPITVDQPEYHYRSVPTVVHTQSAIVKSSPIVHSAPVVKSIAAPVVQTYASPALSYAAHHPVAYGYNSLPYASHVPAYGYAGNLFY